MGLNAYLFFISNLIFILDFWDMLTVWHFY